MNKWLYVLGVVLIAGFAGLGVVQLNEAQTPYVTTVAEAKQVKDRPMQFMGDLVKGKSSYDKSTHELVFTVRGKDGDTMRVRYTGVKPANFDSADSAVVRGTYRGGELDATQVLLKCPSKYKNR